MEQNINRQVRLKSRPAGIPQAEHFEIVNAPVPDLGDNEVLVRNIYLSVEPAMRGWVSDVANYSEPIPLGAVMSFVTTRPSTTKQIILTRRWLQPARKVLTFITTTQPEQSAMQY
jgi:NADPH-dependent curcumin reductase CurA